MFGDALCLRWYSSQEAAEVSIKPAPTVRLQTPADGKTATSLS